MVQRAKNHPGKEFSHRSSSSNVVAGLTMAPYWLESTWVSIAYILLYAESQNLGALTYTPSETVFLKKLLNIPDDYHPVVILPLGNPAERPSPETRARKPLEQIVYLNRYSDKKQ